MKLSVFKNFNKVVGEVDVENISEYIRNGRYRAKVKKLQVLLSKGKEKEYKESKKKLPAFTPSANFVGGRKMEFLQAYSKQLILDIDKIDTETLHKIKQQSIQCKYTHLCFISPSGKGLKILIKVNTGIAKHKESYEELKVFYENLLKVKIDKSGKDITRLCFFSYDKDLYYNPQSETFIIEAKMNTIQQVEQLIQKIEQSRIDITGDYETWLKIGFAIESEFGETGRNYFHSVSKYNPDYSPETCNEQFDKCLKNNNSGIGIGTLFHYAKQNGISIRFSNKNTSNKTIQKQTLNDSKQEQEAKITTNKFTITEEYLNKRYDIRYNVISNKFEYKEKEEDRYREMNENNMFIRLQKDNINISLNHLIALLKSDFVKEYNVFQDYFESLPEWDEHTDYIQQLCDHLITKTESEKNRLNLHFTKWLVRVVRNAIDDTYFNKQCFVLVSNKQNSGKSTFCRNLCPTKLNDYIVESIGTDKDSQIAITENFLINLDELSQAEKAEINAFKSMFSKEKIKARLTYDRRASIHVRRANFLGSTDRWEFLSDENGSVRWLCFDIDYIDWNYAKDVDIDMVYSQAYSLLKNTSFEYEITVKEIKENDGVNKKYQVSTTERDLLQKFFIPGTKDDGIFMTPTDIIAVISNSTNIKLNPVQIGKELKFLGYERVIKYINPYNRYGYYVKIIDK